MASMSALGASYIIEQMKEEAETLTLEECARRVMELVRDEKFLLYRATKEEKFTIVLAVLTQVVDNEEDRERVGMEIDNLKMLDTLLSGVPVDLEKMSEQVEATKNPLQLMKMWQEVSDDS